MGTTLKLVKQFRSEIQKYFFIQRVGKIWISLLQNFLDAGIIKTFKIFRWVVVGLEFQGLMKQRLAIGIEAQISYDLTEWQSRPDQLNACS